MRPKVWFVQIGGRGSQGRVGSSPARRPQVLVVWLAGLALLAACSEQSNVDPDAAVTVRGVVRDSNGAPLVDRPVRLGSGVTDLEGAAGALTVGLFCLDGACSGDSFDATTADDGTFSIELTGSDTQSSFGEATSFLLSTSASPRGASPAGPAISARFRIQTTDVVLPDLDLLDPSPTLEAAGGAVAMAWDAAMAPGPTTVSFVDPEGTTVWQAQADTPLSFDGRVLEDAFGQATVSGSRADAIEGSDVTISWRSSSVAFRGGFGPPPSRGASCELYAADGTMQAIDDCGLTDGALGRGAVPASVCPDEPDVSTTTACAAATRVRVRFPSPIPADLVVVRGCADPCRAAVVPDGATESIDAGPMVAGFGTAMLDGAAVAAVDIATPDVPALAEVSVWSPVTGVPALLPIDDPATFGATDDDERRWPVVAAIGLLLVAGLALGVVLGQRSRRARSAGPRIEAGQL
jgi:hypothetical protein